LMAKRTSKVCAGGIVAVLLAGCAQRTVVPRNILVVCPPEPPEVHCPAWPEGVPATVRELMGGYLRGSLAHYDCSRAVQVWEASWRACQGEPE